MNVGRCKTSDLLITPLGVPDRISVVCLMHDTRNINLQQSENVHKPKLDKIQI